MRADGDVVGLVVVARSHSGDQPPRLWRLLVDHAHQRHGIGGAVIDLVADQCRAWGAEELLVSWSTGKGSPGPMFLATGFVPTGGGDGEIEAHRVLE